METEHSSSSSKVGNTNPPTDWSPVLAEKEYGREKELQTDILKTFGALPSLRIWRENTGLAFGYSQVRAAVALLKIGKIKLALAKFGSMAPTRYGTPGRPDIMGILLVTGRSIAIEVKFPGEVLEGDQVKWRAMFERYNGLYILAYSLQDVFTALSDAGATL